MKDRVILYKDKNNDTELVVKATMNEALAWGGLSMCDTCGNVVKELYLCPELGHRAICDECFKAHKKDLKWYVEDLHVVFNTLIQYVLDYDLGWSDKDLDTIDEFFASKGHYSLSIKKFIEENKKGGN